MQHFDPAVLLTTEVTCSHSVRGMQRLSSTGSSSSFKSSTPNTGIAGYRVIHLHPYAPAKPAVGAPCNGCGVCCAAQPCPVGMWVSRSTQGRCAALLWNDAEQRHRCGVVAEPQHWLPWLPRGLARALALRWISAATGCDSDLQTH